MDELGHCLTITIFVVQLGKMSLDAGIKRIAQHSASLHRILTIIDSRRRELLLKNIDSIKHALKVLSNCKLYCEVVVSGGQSGGIATCVGSKGQKPSAHSLAQQLDEVCLEFSFKVRWLHRARFSFSFF